MDFKGFIARKKYALISVAIGATGGFLYWNYVGCASGSCAITSNPVISTLYGALMGWFVGDLFSPEEKQKLKKQ